MLWLSDDACASQFSWTYAAVPCGGGVLRRNLVLVAAGAGGLFISQRYNRIDKGSDRAGSRQLEVLYAPGPA